MDSITYEILIWKHIQTERVDDYKYLLIELLALGYTILSVTIDGKRGVNWNDPKVVDTFLFS